MKRIEAYNMKTLKIIFVCVIFFITSSCNEEKQFIQLRNKIVNIVIKSDRQLRGQVTLDFNDDFKDQSFLLQDINGLYEFPITLSQRDNVIISINNSGQTIEAYSKGKIIASGESAIKISYKGI